MPPYHGDESLSDRLEAIAIACDEGAKCFRAVGSSAHPEAIRQETYARTIREAIAIINSRLLENANAALSRR